MTENGMVLGADAEYDRACERGEQREQRIDDQAHFIRLQCQHLSRGASELISDACADPEEMLEQIVRAVTRNYDDLGRPRDLVIGEQVRGIVERLIRAHAAYLVDRRD